MKEAAARAIRGDHPAQAQLRRATDPGCPHFADHSLVGRQQTGVKRDMRIEAPTAAQLGKRRARGAEKLAAEIVHQHPGIGIVDGMADRCDLAIAGEKAALLAHRAAGFLDPQYHFIGPVGQATGIKRLIAAVIDARSDDAAIAQNIHFGALAQKHHQRIAAHLVLVEPGVELGCRPDPQCPAAADQA